jgi:GR25 family glycosyltransferase involved in LPS biosynthesis
MQKKTETLKREIIKLDGELQELESKRKKAKHAAHKAAEEVKVEFLRSAAVIQRQLDADADETEQIKSAVARDERELEELRRRLREQNEQQAEHRAQLERATQDKLADLQGEIRVLRDWRPPQSSSVPTSSKRAFDPGSSHVRSLDEQPEHGVNTVLGLLINLDRRADRLAKIRALRLPLEWERLEAVDGRTLSWAKLGQDQVLHPDALTEAQWAEAHSLPTICRETGSFSPHLTYGAVGCALSHRKAWQALLDSPPYRECALIMEDDLSGVARQFDLQLGRLLSELPNTWHIVFLGYHESSGRLLPVKQSPRHFEQPPAMCLTGLYAYLLHRRGAQALLQPQAVFPLRHQVDVAVSLYPWPAGSRFILDPQAVLAACPKSEDGACDTDVQSLGKPTERAHAAIPQSMMLM